MALAELIPESDYTATMKPVRQATHAPGHIYSDSEIYALEKEKIFLKDWLAIARVEELEDPGDFMTFRISDEPIVVTRDNAAHSTPSPMSASTAASRSRPVTATSANSAAPITAGSTTSKASWSARHL